MLAIVIAAVVLVFVVRLFDVQVLSAAAINERADGRRGVSQVVWGDRGEILDRDGTVLAGTVDRFNITASPSTANSFERSTEGQPNTEVGRDQALGEVAAILGVDAATLIAIIDQALADNPGSLFAYLAQGVELEQYLQIRELDIPWLGYERRSARIYPNGAVAGNLTGFLGSDGAPLAGLEYSQDACLAGTNGEITYERSADWVAIPGTEVTVTEMRSGGDLQLTIDADIQWYAQQIIAQEVLAMQGSYGHVTVLEVETGQVIAAAEYPSVDPNDPGSSDSADRGSRVFTSPYEPGSTLKALTAAAVLDRGLTTTTEVLQVPGSFEQNGASFSDDTPHETIPLTTAGIMAQSSNVGIAMLGERLSAADREDYLRAFGLGEPTASGFLGEEQGLVYPAEDWDAQTNYATMFGQGLLVTAPQIASAYQALGNGGVRLPVQLVAGCTDEDGQLVPAASGSSTQVVSAQAAADTLTLLEAVAQSGAYADTVAIPGYRVGVKTGTAQIADGEGGYLSGQYFTSMAGIAPIDDPKYVVLVSIMNPTTMRSSGATAPAWHDVMAYVLQKNRVPASPQPWPVIATTD